MTATLAASTAILRVRYPDGRLPKALYEKGKYKFLGTIPKREDFTGEYRVVALQNENPQGSSQDFQTALGSLAQGTYNRFQVQRVEHFGIARIKGQALKAAEGNEGALVDLWKNETDGISMTELMNHEIYLFGNGSGVLGRVASGQATATITLSKPTDASKFSLGERLNAVSDNTLSPTLRNGTATITAIDRVGGTLTVATTWTGQITDLAASDYLVRAGDYAVAGTARVLSGFTAWVPGGTSPGTFFNLNRNTDPTRLAGQSFDASGYPLEDAFIEASARVNQVGAPQPTRAFAHSRRFGDMKKSLGTKVQYPRSSASSTIAGVSFSGVDIEGDEGAITVLTSPFIDVDECHLLYPEAWKLDTIGPAPHLQDYDSNNFLRVASDDAYEARFVTYGNAECNMPFANIRIVNFGA